MNRIAKFAAAFIALGVIIMGGAFALVSPIGPWVFGGIFILVLAQFAWFITEPDGK